jgi:DNA ligase-associated metallophosphoesterase
MLDLELEGETVSLRADGSLFWHRHATLVIADPHFGKDDIFRRSGIAIPRGPTLLDLERLSGALAATNARRLLIVGDFVHGRSRAGDDLPRQFALWRRRHPALPVLLVAGNHDRHEDWTAWREVLTVQHQPLHEPPFVFAHDPAVDPRGFVIAGHLHPVYRNPELLGAGALRVFWRQRGCLVLPSWGQFTGGWKVTPSRSDGLFACTPEGVLALQTGSPT